MKLLMSDYYGVCDENGAPLGHSAKVLREYASMLQGDLEISAAVSPCLAGAATADDADCGAGNLFQTVHRLSYDIVETKGYGLGKRITDKVKLFRNIREVYHLAREYDAVWFYRTDFFLFLYAYLHARIRGTRMVCLVYQQSFTGGRLEPILQHIYRKGLQRFDLVINTNPHITIDHPCVFSMPDYTYDPAEYASYLQTPRENMAVCVGAMNPYKQLEETAEAFTASGVRLRIAGKFFDADRAERLREMAGENIQVEDRILSTEAYYRALAGAKYAMIPYDMNQYRNRTSGVLQECIFLGTIPIAPREFLEQNEVPGLGYDSFEQLRDPAFLQANGIEDQLASYRNHYDRKVVGAALRQALTRETV